MKDTLGSYYFPDPMNRKLRVYVRMNDSGEIEFRLFHEEQPEIWERHPWLPHDVLSAADDLYRRERNEKADVIKIYDLSIARALLDEKSRV